jgi:hypothetical protein
MPRCQSLRGWLRVLGTMVLPAVLLFSAGRLQAAGNLRLELAKVARDIQKLLDDRKKTTLAVGAFTGPSRIDSSARPSIALLLPEELNKLGITVTRRAKLEIKGDYLDVDDRETGLLAAMLKFRILDREGTEILALQRGVFGDATIPELFGLTVQLPPDADPKARSQQFRDGIDRPRAHLADARISAGRGSPFAIEVLIKSGDKFVPRAAREEDGLAFVPIKRGEVYAVRLINEAAHEAAVSLTIDGLSMFAFSDVKDARTGQARYTQVILSPRQSVEIKGWHRTNELSDSFLVTEYARSAAAELRSTANIGTITASFAASWPKDAKPPADEPGAPSERSRSADATGRGPQIKEKYVEVERNFGVIRATVSVRYSK